MSQDTSSPPVRFQPRPRRSGEGALTVVSAETLGPACPVLDFAFQGGRDRIVALRVELPGHGPAVVDALFTTPTRSGLVRVPPPHGRGWSGRETGRGAVRWVSSLLAAPVLSCEGVPLGRVVRVVVDHLRQRLVDLVLDQGERLHLDQALILKDGSVLVDDERCVHSPVEQWLAWQQDIEQGHFWWDGRLRAPPPLEPLRASARV